MDDFNNFFDDQRSNPQPERTPVYHTPEPPRQHNKNNTALIICIIIAAIMCIVVVVNVIVLATLKTKIADEYAASIADQMKQQYSDAIKDQLSDTDIVNDITEAAKNQALEALKTSIGQIANDNCSPAVARLYMYESSSANPSTTKASGVASGFLISDTDANGTLQRYLATNAHCVRYEKPTSLSSVPWGKPDHTWATFGKIIAIFDDNPRKYYDLQIVAYGAYEGDHLSAESDQPDLAILRINGTQPSNEDHPSLHIAQSDSITRGSAVALIGNPQGIGNYNSISTGTVSQTGITISSWGSGTFIMTDAAVNGGNSGGPMIDIRGVVVGVVESKLVDEEIDNMGFALSAQTLVDFISWASNASNNLLRTTLTINYTLA